MCWNREDSYPEVELILQYRMLNKLKTTILNKLPLQINEKTQRIHPRSPRPVQKRKLSCKDPNLQNIRSGPRREEESARLRSQGGHLFLSADYSQIELVVLAHMADDPGLKGRLQPHRRSQFDCQLIFDVRLISER
jgi:DNA polymerase-1